MAMIASRSALPGRVMRQVTGGGAPPAPGAPPALPAMPPAGVAPAPGGAPGSNWLANGVGASKPVGNWLPNGAAGSKPRGVASAGAAGTPALPSMPKMPKPPSAPPMAVPGAPGAAPQLPSFGPGNDMRTAQIGPGAGAPRLPGRTVQAGAGVDPNAADPRLAGAHGFLDSATQSLQSGPNRVQMAQQALSDFDAGAERPLQRALRSIGQSAAGAGRLGLGATNREMAEEVAAVEADRGRLSNSLARDLAERDASDRFAKADLGRGLVGDQESYGSARRGEQRTERGYRTAVDAENADRLDRADATNYGRDVGERGELRGERAYQRDFASEGFDRSERQHRQEQDDQDRAFGRDVTRAEVGMRGSPAGAYGEAGRQYADEAANGGLARMLEALASRRQGGATPPQGGGAPQGGGVDMNWLYDQLFGGG